MKAAFRARIGQPCALAVALVMTLTVASPVLASPPDQLFDQNSPNMPDSSEQGDHFGSAVAAGDFDGDGYQDLAIGVDHEDIGGGLSVGQVTVIYGGPDGLDAAQHDYLAQGVGSVAGVGEIADRFGSSLAAGDFDGDGYDDLAVGVPSDRVDSGGGAILAGAVQVFYGLSGGLQTVGQQTWRQGSAGVPGVPEDNDLFGLALVAADFNGDGLDDLAIGAPGEDVGAISAAGAVSVIYGSGGGLSALAAPLPARIFTQEDFGGVSAIGDRFGQVLAAGNIDTSDAAADLVISAPDKDVSGKDAAGAVYLAFGSGTGLDGAASEVWTQSTLGMPGTSEVGDQFGAALAVGDFDSNGAADLAIGIPGKDLVEGILARIDAGAVMVLFASSSGGGLTLADTFRAYRQDVGASSNGGERFGLTLAVGNLDGVPGDEIVVGSPRSALGAADEVGVFDVVALDAHRDPVGVVVVRRVGLVRHAVGPATAGPAGVVRGSRSVREAHGRRGCLGGS